MFTRIPFRQPEFSAQKFAGPLRLLSNKPEPKTVLSDNFANLSRIFDHTINLCLIQRPYPPAIKQFVDRALLDDIGSIEISCPVNPLNFDFASLWPKARHVAGFRDWLEDVEMLASAFCDLFGLRETGLRLCSLDKAMCPRFHVDRSTARLICSYGGIGTEWLPEHAVNRHKLGVSGHGIPDTESGLILDPAQIQQMPAYAVGLMKGENWEGNEGRGFVHRSPTPTANQPRRLLLTLDML